MVSDYRAFLARVECCVVWSTRDLLRALWGVRRGPGVVRKLQTCAHIPTLAPSMTIARYERPLFQVGRPGCSPMTINTQACS